MILHPGVLALLASSLATLFFLAVACGVGWQVLRRWDYRSSSPGQLALERRTYLVSAVMNYALGLGVLSGFLFLHTADDLHRLLVGAMCATGSLNANPVGWWALASKASLLFAAGLWICLNRLDQQAENAPLTRLKYALLLPLAPLVLLDAGLLIVYFLGIHPDVITSCCGSLFSAGSGSGLASTLAAFPAVPSLWLFYGGCGLYAGAGAACLRWPAGRWRALLGMLAVVMLGVSLTALVSVFSMYFYELPTHHCPFDILQAGYGYIGYPVYGALALWALGGVLPALFQPLRRHPSLGAAIEAAQRRHVLWSLLAMAAFIVLVTWPVVFGAFRLVR